MISGEYSEAIVEILDILENSDDTIYKKIPHQLIEFWERNKSTTYKPNLNHDKPLNEMKLKQKTKDIITMIYLNYLCDENQREKVIDTLKRNEDNYQFMLRETYNPDNIFKKQIQEEKIEEKADLPIVVTEHKSILNKIINKIKEIFHLKKL